jgi:hypothetical protein
MTKRELIQEYVSGRIDRRDFLVRLTGLGVSGAAALAYAQSLTPSAAASAGRDPNGYLLRAVNAEYGPGGIFQTIVELLQFAAQFLQHILDLIASLLSGLFALPASHGVRALAPIAVGDALPNGDTLTQSDADQLKTLHNQLDAHLAAIKSAFGDFGAKAPAAASTAAASEGDITTLAKALNDLVAFQAAVIPTLSGEGAKTSALRATMVTAALVEARHAAFVNQLAGDPPFPDTFAKAATGDDIDAIKSELGG